ncbi:MAG: tRNA uracil 4-sulfurtransferase ThiI [Slackia sp.]|nr:tRNA uracil 4-sulfurtransferase ThiI [Slackia sp.]
MPQFQRISLVHYHELGLKGHNRTAFEKRLMYNVRTLLEDAPVEKVTRISGRVLVMYLPDADTDAVAEAADLLAKVPGVARVSCGFVCERDLDAMYAAADRALGEAGPFDTWKVVARRSHTDFAIDSMEMNQLVGAYLCEHYPDKKVLMKHPDVEVHVEVVQGHAYIYAQTIPGVGGLPVGTAGKVVCLLSSGIDSPVAMWRMARRGATCIGVHFSGRPQTASTSEYLVDDIAHVLERFGGVARVYVVPFGDYQRDIAGMVPPALRIIIYRRLMMRIAERIARKEGAKALVTGESLGQVASQTLDNLAATNAAVDMQIFRPLIGSDKLEIIADAQKLGTFEISSVQAPDCCTLFMPRSPETHAKIADVEAAEEALPWKEWIEEVMASVELHEYRCPSSYKSTKPAAEKTCASGRETIGELSSLS